MPTTERLEEPRPQDLSSADLRPSGDVMTTDGEGAPDPAEDLVDKVIGGGRYKIKGIIGRGGMGVVYSAMHLELDQEVAIKVLPASYARDAETLKRFEREAKTASRVRHPNVVTVFDLGRLDTGEPYLVMELLEGRDLAAVMVERGTLPLDEVVRILRPIAAAIDALHLEGVVHRDIKPGNIFFTKTKAQGEIVKLVDFGLAALHAADGTERLTRVGHVVGTAVYMAPEAARGSLSGPAGDVYALGVVAFELLTGMAPFDGQPMAVLMDKVSMVAPSLSTVTQRAFPASVEAAFAMVLARTPEQRPRDAVAFVDSLRDALRDKAAMPPAGIKSLPPGPMTSQPPTGETAIPGTSLRGPAIGAAVLLLLMTSLGGWYLFGRAPVAPPTSIVPTPAPATDLVIDPMPEAPPPTSAVEAIAPPAPVTTVAAPDHPRAGHPRPTTVAAPPITVAAPPPTTTVAAPPPPTSGESEATSTDRSADLVHQAQAAMLHGQIANARELYEEATQAAPRMSAAWRGLGLASERLGLNPEARRAYERYLEIAPEARDAQTVRDRLSHLQ